MNIRKLIRDCPYLIASLVWCFASGSTWALDVTGLQNRAERGDAAAMVELARAYESGAGTARDERLAVRWYYRAALKDNLSALDALAKMNEDGRGVAKSELIARKWRDRAAVLRGKPVTAARAPPTAASPARPVSTPSAAPTLPVDAPTPAPVAALEPPRPASTLPPPTATPPSVNFRSVIAQAEAGNADAQYQYGKALEDGISLAKSEARAAHWYFRAARQGFVPAQEALALLNEEGRGVPKNPTIAKLWRDRAAGVKARARGDDLTQIAALEPRARNGDAAAQLQLAQLYLDRNHPDGAMVFLRQAAGQNSPRAQYLLGSMLLDRMEFAGGVEWLERAARANDTDAQVALGTWYEAPPTGQANHDLAYEWYTKAAERGNPVAHNNLGAMRYDGRGGSGTGTVARSGSEPAAQPSSGGGISGFFNTIRSAASAATTRSPSTGRDLNAALKHYLIAADSGLAEAQYNAALMLGQGLGIESDTPEAERNQAMVKWLAAAAAQGYARAQAQLARMYLDGDRVEKSTAEAARLFQLAAETDHAWAQYYWGRLLQTGTGVPRNLEEAGKWLERSAKSGVDVAAFEMAQIYESGLGRASDNSQAVAFYQRAAEAGHKQAAERLAKAYADAELGVERNLDESNKWVQRARR